MFQMKEPDKHQKKELSEVELSHLSDKVQGNDRKDA